MSRRKVHLVELIQGPGLSRKATVYWDKDDAIATAELHAQNAPALQGL